MQTDQPTPQEPANAQHAFLLSRLTSTRKFTIVDIGANPVNPPPYRHLLASGGCHMVGFVPQPAAYQAPVAAAGPNESYGNAAVGKSGKGNLRRYPSSGRVKRRHRMPPTVEIDLKGLDDLDEIRHVDMLKMDVQGAELDILQSARRKLADTVVVVPELRYHRLYQNEPLMGDVDSELRRQGFTLHKFLQLHRRHIRNSQSSRMTSPQSASQLLDGDAVYIRNLEDPSGWSDDQLRFLALAAATVFNSQDLALRCMDLLVSRGALAPETPSDYLDYLPKSMVRPAAPPVAQ